MDALAATTSRIGLLHDDDIVIGRDDGGVEFRARIDGVIADSADDVVGRALLNWNANALVSRICATV